MPRGPAATRPTVTLVAVSKTVAADALRDAVAAGLDLLGENRVQEALAKAPEVPGARWQLVGPLQSNKARRALEVFESIQSVDSVELGRAARPARPARSGPAARYPVLAPGQRRPRPGQGRLRARRPRRRRSAGSATLAAPRRSAGLMTVGRLSTDPDEARRDVPRPARAVAERCGRAGRGLGPDLSMGMTDDFEIAVEEGATIVRVGRALFGERPPPARPRR